MFKPNWQMDMISRFRDNVVLLDEVRDVLLYYAREGRDTYLPTIASDIGYAQSPIVLDIRDRVRRFVAKLTDSGALELSRNDHSDDTKYARLTEYGTAICHDGSFRHLVFGPRFTLETSRHAMVLLTANDAAESGTAVHLGEGRFLTCAHCVASGSFRLIDVDHPEESYAATISETDVDADLSTVTCSDLSYLPAVTIANTGAPLLSRVLVLHFPNVPALLRALIATPGEINGRVGNFLRKGNEDMLISARTAPGSSGGGVFSEEGKLCGIVLGSGAKVDSTGAKPDESTWAAEPFYHVIPADQFEAVL